MYLTYISTAARSTVYHRSYQFRPCFTAQIVILTIACMHVVTTKLDKRRSIMLDLTIGVGVPVLAAILCMLGYYSHLLIYVAEYVYQGLRFDIYEDIGCIPSIYYVWPVYPLFSSHQSLLGSCLTPMLF